MSTRSTIGLVGDYHLYIEWRDETLSLHRPSGSSSGEVLTIMPSHIWEKIQLKIISNWLCEIQNGHGTLENVWDCDGYLNREKILENLKELLKTVTK